MLQNILGEKGIILRIYQVTYDFFFFFRFKNEKSTSLNDDLDKISKDLVDEEVFKKSFIPRTLDDVFDVERDTLKVSKGEGDEVSET